MNLRERFNIVKDNQEKLVLVSINNNNGNFQLSNLIPFRNALLNIGELDLFKADVKEISDNIALFTTGSDGLVVPSNQYDILTRKLSDILSKSGYLIEFFSEDLTLGEDVLEIKLPSDTVTFEDLSKVASQLKIAFELPLNSLQVENSRVEIKSADPGSVWLNVAFGSLAAIKIIGLLIDKAIFIANERQKYKANKLMMENMKAENDLLNKMQETSNKYFETITTSLAQEIAMNTTKANDPEVIRVLEVSLKGIGDLKDKGAKFIPASKDPKTRELFPKMIDFAKEFDPSRQITES